MYIAMNRFAVLPGQEAAFEEVWLSRETHLDGTPGFVAFHLLRLVDVERCGRWTVDDGRLTQRRLA